MSYDPEMSEWGNPPEETSGIHAPTHNAWRGTRGTETSKYPEEKKETSISKVAASEMERGQTRMRASWGSDRIIDSASLMERFWESRPERVKAPYMKDELTWRYPEYHETRGTLWERAGTTP